MKSQLQRTTFTNVLVLSTLVLSTLFAQAQTKTTADMKIAILQAEPAPTRVILVSLEDRRLALIEDGKVKKVYLVAVGKGSTPSPTGTFTIQDRVANPAYYHDGKVIPPGQDNPVGTRWMGLSREGYGIHGTNEPRSIGKASSHGCIRMSRRDLEDLFAQVRTGDTVEIVGDRNEETAAIFGTPLAPAQTLASQSAPEMAPQTPRQTAAAAAATVAAMPAILPVGQ